MRERTSALLFLAWGFCHALLYFRGWLVAAFLLEVSFRVASFLMFDRSLRKGEPVAELTPEMDDQLAVFGLLAGKRPDQWHREYMLHRGGPVAVPILDHGRVEFVDKCGSDERVIEAARTSFAGGFVSWDPYDGHPKGDTGLLAYLNNNRHSTPFEMCDMTIMVAAPIMVFREWHRHRTQSYNEMSARYMPLPDVNYVPEVSRLMLNADGTNKQAGRIAGAGQLDEMDAAEWRDRLQYSYRIAQRVYENGLAMGVPKELARLSVPVGRYSLMMAKANLRNWLAFLTLRMDEKAQWEIRMYANAVGQMIQWHFPRTWELFRLGRE